MSGGEDNNEEKHVFSNLDYMTRASIHILVNVEFTRLGRHVCNKLSFPMV
jgi:hypothetical protein